MQALIVWISRHEIIMFALLIYLAITYWLLKFEKQLNLQCFEASLIAVVHVVVGWTCMRLMAFIEVGFDFEKAANMRLYGAIFVVPFIYYAWARITKRNVFLVMDVSAICVVFGAISGRLNCLTQGCCKGVQTLLNGSFRWPLREVELLYYVAFIIFFAISILKRKTHGQVYPIYLITYGILRFFSEFVREEFTTQIGVLHLAHIWSLLSIIAGIIWLYLLNINNCSIAKDKKADNGKYKFRRK